MNYLRAFPFIRTVIDNSKKTAWAKRFLNIGDYELKFIHLIRDPRALVRRWLMNNDTPEKRRKKRFQLARNNLFLSPWILSGSDEEVFAYKWLVDNRRITRFFENNRLDFRIVTYRDIAVDTNMHIEKIVHWLGYEFEPDQVNYWNYKHHGSRKKDYDFAGKDGTRVFDLRWKSYLSTEAQLSITENKCVKRYLDELIFV